MSVYLDTSVLVALFTDDALSPRADAALRGLSASLIASDFGGLELASSVARMVRIKVLSPAEAHAALADFDVWMQHAVSLETSSPDDVAVAARYIRGLDLNLRGPDALHIAIAHRLGAALLTFDDKMKASARKLRVPLV